MQTVPPRTRRFRAVGVMCAVLASAALVTGCGQDSGDGTSAATSEAAKVIPKQTTSPSSTAQLTQAQTARKNLLSQVKVTFDKAAKTAVAEVSGSKLAELDLEGLDDGADESASPSPGEETSASPTGSPSPSPSPSASASPSGTGAAPKWTAEVVEQDGTAHTVTIDAVSGKVIDSTTDTDQSAADKSRLTGWLATARQTPQQAAKVATDKKKGTVTSAGLEMNDDSNLVWAVDVVTPDWNKTDFEIDAVKGTIVREQTDVD